MTGRVLRPGCWNHDGVAVPDQTSERIDIPEPIVRAPAIPRRHRPTVQRSLSHRRWSAAAALFVAGIAIGSALTLIVARAWSFA